MNNRYIFIVGLPRTGSKLMKTVICASSEILCRLTPETWYLGDMFRSGLVKSVRTLGDMRDDANIERLVQLMYSGQVRGTYWNVLGSKYLDIPQSTMEELLKASNRSERDIYEVIMRAPVVVSHGEIAASNAILGDKMPGNLFHVPLLLQWFPGARIVHTFRDPRAILASEWQKLNNLQKGGRLAHTLTKPLKGMAIALYVTVTWLYAVRLHRRYLRQYPDQYRLVRFEDLVSEPEKTAQELCAFLEFKFNRNILMLQPAKFGSSYTKNEGSGFNLQSLDHWRQHLPPWMRKWLNFMTGSRLSQFGYER